MWTILTRFLTPVTLMPPSFLTVAVCLKSKTKACRWLPYVFPHIWYRLVHWMTLQRELPPFLVDTAMISCYQLYVMNLCVRHLRQLLFAFIVSCAEGGLSHFGVMIFVKVQWIMDALTDRFPASLCGISRLKLLLWHRIFCDFSVVIYMWVSSNK